MIIVFEIQQLVTIYYTILFWHILKEITLIRL